MKSHTDYLVAAIAFAAWCIAGCHTVCDLPSNIRLYPADSVQVVHSNPWVDLKIQDKDYALFDVRKRNVKSVEVRSVEVNRHGDSTEGSGTIARYEYDRHGLPLRVSLVHGTDSTVTRFLFECDSSGVVRHFKWTTTGGLGEGTYNEEYYNYNDGKLNCIGRPDMAHDDARGYRVSYHEDGVIREISNSNDIYAFNSAGRLENIFIAGPREPRGSSSSLSKEFRYDSLGRVLMTIVHNYIPSALLYTYDGDRIESMMKGTSTDPLDNSALTNGIFYQYDSTGLLINSTSFTYGSNRMELATYRFTFH